MPALRDGTVAVASAADGVPLRCAVAGAEEHSAQPHGWLVRRRSSSRYPDLDVSTGMKPSLWNRRGSASAQFPAAAAAVSPGPRRPNSASSREAIPVRRASRGSVAVELQASPSQVPGRDCDSSWPVSLTAAAPAADECRPWWMVLTAHHGVGLIWLACRHDARGDGPLCRRAAGRRSGLPTSTAGSLSRW
jgi:hypothetical protein